MPQAKCARCGAEFVAQLWLDDLKTVVDKLGFDYSLGDGKTLQDYCPRCKRIMRALSYANLPQVNEPVFRGSRVPAGDRSETIN
jgi:DNA-directed RNA polymerase subunit RPC12/RpoP